MNSIPPGIPESQPFPFGQRSHDLQGITQDHAVLPLAFMLVKLGSGRLPWQAVEVGEQIQLLGRFLCLGFFALAAQIIHQYLGMHFFLDIEGRRLHHQVRPVLYVLAAPDQLRVQIPVAPLIGNPQGCQFIIPHHGLKFGSGDILAACLIMGDGVNAFGRFCFLFCHTCTFELVVSG